MDPLNVLAKFEMLEHKINNISETRRQRRS